MKGSLYGIQTSKDYYSFGILSMVDAGNMEHSLFRIKVARSRFFIGINLFWVLRISLGR